ncbi:molybdate transporter subunit; ATP-binding component of ABC superfamily [Burkholderiales bacterium 8X]|nr:molybdate transporter subunit; ATP-binding component of ABC superfamily [Burkholderiales bacterium 8X]
MSGAHAGIYLQMNVEVGSFRLQANLTLPGNSITALWGPSGCGKTTFLRTLAGLQPSPTTRVRVNGEPWQDTDVFLPAHRRGVGYVFQDTRLFDHLDVKRNIAYGMQRVPKAERRVSLTRTVELLGIGHLMSRKPDTLSGGERQRVGIARALATSPKLLLMDEPLASLDAERKREILPYIAQLQAEHDIPVIYVTHSQDEVGRLADWMVLLEGGRSLASGPAADLLTRLDLPIAHGDSASALLYGAVDSHDRIYGLTHVKFQGGVLSLPHGGTTTKGQLVRLRVQARDVSLAMQPASETSVLNILPAVVSDLAEDGPAQTMVGLDVGGSRLLARITRRSARMLGIEPGLKVYAQLKGVAIID